MNTEVPDLACSRLTVAVCLFSYFKVSLYTFLLFLYLRKDLAEEIKEFIRFN